MKNHVNICKNKMQVGTTAPTIQCCQWTLVRLSNIILTACKQTELFTKIIQNQRTACVTLLWKVFNFCCLEANG